MSFVVAATHPVPLLRSKSTRVCVRPFVPGFQTHNGISGVHTPRTSRLRLSLPACESATDGSSVGGFRHNDPQTWGRRGAWGLEKPPSREDIHRIAYGRKPRTRWSGLQDLMKNIFQTLFPLLYFMGIFQVGNGPGDAVGGKLRYRSSCRS